VLAHVLSRSSGSVGFFCFPMFGRVPPNADRSSFRLFWFLLLLLLFSGCYLRSGFWSLIHRLRDSGLFFLQPLVCGGFSRSFLRGWNSPIHPCWYVQGLMQCQGFLGGLGGRGSLHPPLVCGVEWMLGFLFLFVGVCIRALRSFFYGRAVLIFCCGVSTLRSV
jgi:hypothetical protein